MRLALFDLDNTLLAGDSDFEWAQFLIDEGVLDRELYNARNEEFFRQYRMGVLDIHEFLDFQLKPLSRHPREELDAWHARYMAQRIRPIILEPARELVRRHQHRGDLCAIVTATNSFVTRPIAAEFGVEHLLATEPEQVDGRYTGGVTGTPCFRQGKVERLEQWLGERAETLAGFSESCFYSDSLNDLPLLDEVLRAHALERCWRIISLRSGRG
jgi:HAD superfamily hydrolase (TIGR01490 family)